MISPRLMGCFGRPDPFVMCTHRGRSIPMVESTCFGTMGGGYHLGWLYGRDLHCWHHSTRRTFSWGRTRFRQRSIFCALWCWRVARPIHSRDRYEHHRSQWLPVVTVFRSYDLRFVCSLSPTHAQTHSSFLTQVPEIETILTAVLQPKPTQQAHH